MSLISRTPAQVTAQQHEEAAALTASRKRAEFEYTWRGFWASPPGVARRAFKNGDQVFQYEIDVMDQAAIMTAMVGSSARVVRLDPSAVVNAVCREGWELLSGDFVFVSDDAPGQTVMGFYLFKRREENREPETEEQLARRLGWEGTVLDQPEHNAVGCPECGQTFANLEAYTAHYQSTHQPAPAMTGPRSSATRTVAGSGRTSARPPTSRSTI